MRSRSRASPVRPGGVRARTDAADTCALADDLDKPLLNRALRGAYPSGSTIKPVIALAGADLSRRSIPSAAFCTGIFHLPGSLMHLARGQDGRHGDVDLQQAISRSCDVYFYDLASLGVDRIDAFLWPVRLWAAYRHRYLRGEAGATALARMEEDVFQRRAGSGVVPR